MVLEIQEKGSLSLTLTTLWQADISGFDSDLVEVQPDYWCKNGHNSGIFLT